MDTVKNLYSNAIGNPIIGTIGLVVAAVFIFSALRSMTREVSKAVE